MEKVQDEVVWWRKGGSWTDRTVTTMSMLSSPTTFPPAFYWPEARQEWKWRRREEDKQRNLLYPAPQLTILWDKCIDFITSLPP